MKKALAIFGVVGSTFSTLSVHAETPELAIQIPTSIRSARSVHYCPDGKYHLAGQNLFELSTGYLIRTAEIPSPINEAAISPEGLIATLSDLYMDLGRLDADRVIVMLDSCFSGARKEAGPTTLKEGLRPVMVQSKQTESLIPKNSKIIALTSSGGDEVSGPYAEKRHGLFSYFLFKGMRGDADKDGDKNLSFGELWSYVAQQVPEASRQVGNPQTPSLQGSNDNFWLANW